MDRSKRVTIIVAFHSMKRRLKPLQLYLSKFCQITYILAMAVMLLTMCYLLTALILTYLHKIKQTGVVNKFTKYMGTFRRFTKIYSAMIAKTCPQKIGGKVGSSLGFQRDYWMNIASSIVTMKRRTWAPFFCTWPDLRKTSGSSWGKRQSRWPFCLNSWTTT